MNWLTHLIVFALGVATWLPFTLWEGRHITEQDTDVTPDSNATAPSSKPHGPNRGQWLGIVILVVSLLFAGFGIQQYQYQSDNTDQVAQSESRDACYEQWGMDVIDTLKLRVSVGRDVTRAERAKDKAVDNVLLTALDIVQSQPSDATVRLSIALNKFSIARDQLETVSAQAQATREANPYPEIDCGGNS